MPYQVMPACLPAIPASRCVALHRNLFQRCSRLPSAILLCVSRATSSWPTKYTVALPVILHTHARICACAIGRIPRYLIYMPAKRTTTGYSEVDTAGPVFSMDPQSLRPSLATEQTAVPTRSMARRALPSPLWEETSRYLPRTTCACVRVSV